MASGLKDFLKHIESHPLNDVLIDRFTALLKELPVLTRQRYLEQLVEILEPSNPLGALRASYAILQANRSQQADTALEIEILQWIERVFLKLEKKEQAALVKAEAQRLADAAANGSAKKVVQPRPAPAADAEPQPLQMDKHLSKAIKMRPRLMLDALRLHLGEYTGQPQTADAAAHMIAAFQQLYTALSVNQLAAAQQAKTQRWWADQQGLLNPELVEVLLLSPLFLPKTQDRLGPERAVLIATLLTGWFDQQASRKVPLQPEQQRVQKRLLELAISAALRFEDK